MSATNRGAARRKDDFYETPLSASKALSIVLPPGITTAFDPCAGRGAIFAGLPDRVARAGIEINAEMAAAYGWECRDGLSDKPWDVWKSGCAVVMNPPFSLAQEFCERAMSEANVVAALLRLSFLASKKRVEFWRTCRPCDVYVLAARLSFTAGGTDSCDYAWFAWHANAANRWSRLEN